MIIKLIINKKKEDKIISAWIQKDKEVEQDLQQLLEFA